MTLSVQPQFDHQLVTVILLLLLPTCRIEEANYDGTCRRTIAFTSGTHLFALSYMQDHLLWTDDLDYNDPKVNSLAEIPKSFLVDSNGLD